MNIWFSTKRNTQVCVRKISRRILVSSFLQTNIKATLAYCLGKKLLVFCQNIRARHRDIVSNFAFKKVKATFVNVYCRNDIIFLRVTHNAILDFTIYYQTHSFCNFILILIKDLKFLYHTTYGNVHSSWWLNKIYHLD